MEQIPRAQQSRMSSKQTSTGVRGTHLHDHVVAVASLWCPKNIYSLIYNQLHCAAVILSEMIRLSLPNGRVELVHPPPPEDDEGVVEISTHPLILKRLPFWSKHQTVDEAAKRRKTRTNDPEHYRDFRVHPHPGLDNSSLPPMMGSAGFLDIDTLNDAAQMGIVLHPDIHRGGYASEILLLLFNHGFASHEAGGMGLNRIYLTTAHDNVQMRGWLENVLGLTMEGVFKEAWKNREQGGYIDAVGYAILKGEWEDGGRDRVEKKLKR